LTAESVATVVRAVVSAPCFDWALFSTYNNFALLSATSSSGSLMGQLPCCQPVTSVGVGCPFGPNVWAEPLLSEGGLFPGFNPLRHFSLLSLRSTCQILTMLESLITSFLFLETFHNLLTHVSMMILSVEGRRLLVRLHEYAANVWSQSTN
jgi:hypothetical protein